MLTYGRYFAEFLNEDSLVHLGTLMPAYLCRFAVRLSDIQAANFFLAPLQFKLARPKLCLPASAKATADKLTSIHNIGNLSVEALAKTDVHTIERSNIQDASVIGFIPDSAGILTCSSIDYAFRPRLRID